MVIYRDGGGKEGPGQRLETSSEKAGLRAILPVVLSEPLLGTCVHVEDSFYCLYKGQFHKSSACQGTCLWVHFV